MKPNMKPDNDPLERPTPSCGVRRAERSFTLEEARARIDHFNRLKALGEMEDAFSKRFKKLEERIWHELAPSLQTNRPCSLKAWSMVWDEMLELDNALRLVKRLRQSLVAKERSARPPAVQQVVYLRRPRAQVGSVQHTAGGATSRK